jgi:hypothetical protein
MLSSTSFIDFAASCGECGPCMTATCRNGSAAWRSRRIAGRIALARSGVHVAAPEQWPPLLYGSRRADC